MQTKSTLAAPKMSFETNEFYLRSSEEMASAFAEWPDALASTLEIAERCDVELELGKQLIPRYLPEGEDEGALPARARDARACTPATATRCPAEALARAEAELAVIDRMGFNAYFLIVWDFVKWAKDHGIAVGPGRGSAAGSIVAYALRITDVDPLRYGLLFERFLNPERVSMPDIDIDFSVRGRERVLQYVVSRYGRESVAQIVTFGRMFPRAATRDAARVLGHDYGVGDRLAKLIPDPIMGRPPSFDDCLKPGEPLRGAVDSDPTAKQIVDVARGLEGIVRNSSIHAAAVVIAGMPLTDVVPLQLADAGTAGTAGEAGGRSGERQYRMVTQFSMKPVEDLGLLKMDFLGLRNLDVIEDALDIIERSTGVERPDMSSLPLDDEATYDDARPRRLRGRVPVRVRGHAGGPAQGAPDRVRRPRRARRAVPPGRDGPDPDLRPRQARPADRLHPGRAPGADHRPDLRGDPVPGAGDADLQGARRLLGGQGRRPAQGHRQEEPRGHGPPRARVPRRLRGVGDEPPGHRLAVGDEREERGLLLQQVPRCLLRAHRLPHGLAEGQLPRRVHGGADLVGHVDEGQGARSSPRAATRWASRSCPPTSTSPTTSSSSSTATSASGWTR